MQKTNEKSSKIKDFMIKIKNSALNALYPTGIKCIFCDRDIPDFENKPYCENCEKNELFNTGNRCMFCDMQIPEGNRLCDFCAQNHRAFEKAFCPLSYHGDVRRTILKFKNDNGRYLAQPLAKLIYDRVAIENVKIDLVIPVPSQKKTLKQRGYNQSALLAQELAKMLDCEYSDIVTKTKVTADQKTLKYAKRLTNLEGSFELIDKKIVKNKNILIVDDIMTTGSTLNEIAKLLKEKAARVYVAAAARDNFDQI